MPATKVQDLQFEINVTPFLDVLLVLIIVFLASMSARKAMDAVLPQPCTGACAGHDASIVLEVLRDGSYRINRTPVAPGMLATTLRGILDPRPDKVIQVAGHRDVRYQDVLSAMDVARDAGARVISIPPSESYSSP
jgi:biopolymer transport protein ExbD